MFGTFSNEKIYAKAANQCYAMKLFLQYQEINSAAPLLNSNSVMTITGAVTQLGSALATSLHYTYNTSNLILIDEMIARDA